MPQKLFDDLMSEKFDWDAFVRSRRTMMDAKLSDAFISDVHPVCLGSGLMDAAAATTLGDIVTAARQRFIAFGPLSDQLDLVYRKRDMPVQSPVKQASPEKSAAVPSSDSEDDDLAVAIAMSLEREPEEEAVVGEPVVPSLVEVHALASPNPATPTKRRSRRLAKSSINNEPMTGTAPAGPDVIDVDALPATPFRPSRKRTASAPDLPTSSSKSAKDSKRPAVRKTASVADTPSPAKKAKTSAASHKKKMEGDIVGISSFAYDEKEMAEFCADMGQLWRSEREPRGVDIEDVGRICRSCEFAEGCEWLEKQAEAAVQKNKELRAARANPVKKVSQMAAVVTVDEEEAAAAVHAA